MSIRIIAQQMSTNLNRSVRSAARNQLNLRHKSTAEGSFSASKNLNQSVSSTKSNESQSVPLLQTAVAAAMGIATVSVTAATVEIATSSTCPDFDPSGQRFDQSTFIGRFSKMILACDPRLLLYSEAETRSAKEMVQDHKNLLQNLPEGMTIGDMNHALWEAQRISSASLHPDTGEVIPAPFRMSGYVPFNGPICVSMVASTSTPALLFWSWINQSHNALVNYYNRNASSEMSNETLAKSYFAAVASSLIVAFGLSTFIQKRFDAEKAKKLMRWVAFPSAIVASSLNCYIIRSPEIDTGVPLVNENGEDVLPGKTSKQAATNGVNSTTASRALLQAPVYFLPPVLMASIPVFKKLVARNPLMTVPLTTYLVLTSFGLGLPATVAIFPQMAEIDVKDCEDEFQGLVDSSGKPYKKFYYNKGL
jgi:tricarboxylate carrier